MLDHVNRWARSLKYLSELGLFARGEQPLIRPCRIPLPNLLGTVSVDADYVRRWHAGAAAAELDSIGPVANNTT